MNALSTAAGRVLTSIFAVVLLLTLQAAHGQIPDYSSPADWVICEKEIRENCDVDLFYVLPTIYSHKDNAWMLWQDDEAIRQKAQTIAAQHTGIFSGYSRVFAPYYRQAEFRRALTEIHLPVEKQSFIQLGIQDIRNAFRYYLKHLNQGRPFILLGFSQGSMALLEVMKTEFADPAVNARLVAAYLIGYPNMPKNFP
ncbi:MAG: DUF3089 domain-containing protein, partial [Victivallales bacterium]|nr:DUF3089 domain-containing protein [Victivallales bacterium]